MKMGKKIQVVFKSIISRFVKSVCKRQMAYNANQRRRIDEALSYEMRTMPVYMLEERNATRESAMSMKYLHTQSYFVWSDRLKKVEAWANS